MITVRRAAVRTFSLVLVLYLLGLFPGFDALRTVAGWLAAAAVATFAVTVVWAVVSNQRVRDQPLH